MADDDMSNEKNMDTDTGDTGGSMQGSAKTGGGSSGSMECNTDADCASNERCVDNVCQAK